ncbi:hypothetical protein JVT61DRAFT_15528 [Boletus reticuloceps]|uniref:BAH domain-containing protein n=1 Tax=Boletus reticuloceps TaxID=495285 RepID=A0A8I2YCE7_9AGAM|nr:hypothetical protein JVT61DRAFT_15528 [Boletus reticuloceps]
MSYPVVDDPMEQDNTTVTITTRLTPEEVVDHRTKSPPRDIEKYPRYDRVEVLFGRIGSSTNVTRYGVMYYYNVGDMYVSTQSLSMYLYLILHDVHSSVRVHHAGTCDRRSKKRLSEMDYWFAKVEQIYVLDDGRESEKPKIWLNVRWFYRAEDMKGYDSTVAKRMKTRELIDSDEKDYITFTSVEGVVDVAQIDEGSATYDETKDGEDPSAGFFTRWRLEVMTRPGRGTRLVVVGVSLKDACECTCEGCPDQGYDDDAEQRYCDPCQNWMHLACLTRVAKKVSVEKVRTLFKDACVDEGFMRSLTRPIARGGVHKTFGNGNEVMKVRQAWKMLKSGGEVGDWEDEVNMYTLWPEDEEVQCFRCPQCKYQWV